MLISIDFFSLIPSLFDIFVLAVFHPSIHPSICLSNSGSWGGLAPIPAVIGWKAV